MSDAQSSPAPQVAPPRSRPLPRFKVLLHNDDNNEMNFVIAALVELTPLDEDQAVQVTLEAHNTGASLVLVTHKELAELYTEQLTSKGLISSLEPDA